MLGILPRVEIKDERLGPAAECGWGDPHVNSQKTVCAGGYATWQEAGVLEQWLLGMETSQVNIRPVFESGKCFYLVF